MGSLEEDDRSARLCRTRSNHSFRSFDLVGGNPRKENESVGKPRRRQGRQDRARPRDRLDADPGVDGLPDQMAARIRNRRRAGVRDERDVVARAAAARRATPPSAASLCS